MMTQTAQPTRRRFTVHEYHLMAETGILDEDERVELLEGEIIEMASIGLRHISCVDRSTRLLARLFDGEAIVRVQSSVRLNDSTEPQPDLALLRFRPDFYATTPATPDVIFVLVEVGDTTAQLDRRVRAPRYARNGVRELWLVDLEQDAITVCRDPGPDGYRSEHTFRRGERFAPEAFPDREIAVIEILGEGERP